MTTFRAIGCSTFRWSFIYMEFIFLFPYFSELNFFFPSESFILKYNIWIW